MLISLIISIILFNLVYYYYYFIIKKIVPLYNLALTQCRIICHNHEVKPHVKLWLLLNNPALLAEVKSSQLIELERRQFEPSDNISSLQESSSCPSSSFIIESIAAESQSTEPHESDVPILLKDPISCLLLMLVNLPYYLKRVEFNCVVQSVFNMTFVQNIIHLCCEFDKHERENWSRSATTAAAAADSSMKWINFKDYVANIITGLRKTNIFVDNQDENSLDSASANEISAQTTTWSLEKALNYVKTKCVHFLKTASLLQYYFYDEEIEFDKFVNFFHFFFFSKFIQNIFHHLFSFE